MADVEPDVLRVIARSIWAIEQETLPESPDERREAFQKDKVLYNKKARKLAKQFEVRGLSVALAQSDA